MESNSWLNLSVCVCVCVCVCVSVSKKLPQWSRLLVYGAEECICLHHNCQ